ncbi:MAG: isomerizing glutamine--fructose-6-phosphate transaminase [Anaeroplasmataceae bacterium]
MCGLIGMIGNNSLDGVIEGLHRLEYRGYDSCGISYYDGNKYKVRKKCGGVSKLKKYTKASELAIGHTRWATHGSVSKINAHPHETLNFIIVHNGIIDNYLYLKEKYFLKPKSETDTEIVGLLLDYFYKDNTLEAIEKVCGLIEGTYSFLIINKNEKRIYFTKKINPLYITIKDNICITSDRNAYINDFFYTVLDNTIGYIDSKGYFIYKGDIVKEKIISNDLYKTKRNKHYMLDEIEDISDVCSNILKMSFSDEIKNLINKADSINFIASGSSYNASLVAVEILKNKNISSNAYIASEVIDNNIYISNNPLFIYVSQSGETIDVYKVMLKYEKYNSIAITNNKNSIIALKANHNIYMNSGTEFSVAATKTYISQALIFYYLFTGDKDSIIEFKNNLYKIDYSYTMEIARKLKKIKRLILIGSGIEYAVALEGGLKLREVAYITALTIPSGELKHGSIALVDNKTYYISLDMYNKASSKHYEIDSRGGKGIFLNKLYIPNILNSLYEAIILDLITYYIALYNGYSIDKPRNLAKSVTVL